MCDIGRRTFTMNSHSPCNSLCCAKGYVSLWLHIMAKALTGIVRGQFVNELSLMVGHWREMMATNLRGGGCSLQEEREGGREGERERGKEGGREGGRRGREGGREGRREGQKDKD